MYPDIQRPQTERRVGSWCPPFTTGSMAHPMLVQPDYRPGVSNQGASNQAVSSQAFADQPSADDAFADNAPEVDTELSPEARALRVVIEQAVALGFDIEPELLRYPSRGRARTALARQVGMYVAHVGLSFSLTQVGQLFDRDRTTVAHACRLVELRRDDATFDRAIELLERVVRIMCAPARRPDHVRQPVPSPTPAVGTPSMEAVR
jgi:Bacterial dnaA protein helix-turn-helix